MIGKLRFFTPLFFAAVLFATVSPANAGDRARTVAGLVERVLVGSPGVEFEAKLDTGADISSIDATEVTSEKRSGRTWVGFTVVRDDGVRVKLSGRLVRHIHVKRIGGATHQRSVVLLQICLGSISRMVEVSLADRKGFDYDVLIGRNVLSGHFMVDPLRDHVLTLSCSANQIK